MSNSRESLIGLMADPGPDLVVGLVGILRSGAGFVPLSPTQPDERIAMIAADCGLGVVITERRYFERVLGLCAQVPTLQKVICLDELDALSVVPPSVEVRCLAQAPPATSANGDGPLPPESLAYVIYTSGSTGLPKGVGVSHANLVPMLTWSRDYFGLDEATRVLQSLSYAFDFGVWEILSTLISGATLCVCGPEEYGDPEVHARLAVELEIDTVHATPSFFQAMAQSGTFLKGLRRLHLGGEALSRGQAERLAKAVGRDCRLYNGYGPTEVTVNSLIFDAGTPGALSGGERVPIGRPSAGNAVYVLDPFGLVPVGVTGELFVGGPGVARGYLGRPDLTAEKFVPDFLGTEPGGRLYRTGDLVRWLPGGDLEFLGRSDHQVKIRGFRIEPGEVESVLRRHPGVLEAAVTARESRTGGMALVAYVQCEAPPPGAEDLRSFLRRSLPEAMVPTIYVTVDRFPLTASGKVDRLALPAPQWEPVSTVGAAPRNRLEEALAGLWAEVLGLERVGVRESFFELGGHSLLATQLVSRVRETFGVELPLRRLFEVSTVEGMARELADGIARSARAPRQAPPLSRGEEAEEYPLSFAQERLWILDRLEPGNAAYNMPAAVRLEGDLQVDALERSLEALVWRHESLRTCFPSRDGGAVQVIAATASCPLPRFDLRGLPASARQRASDQLKAEEILRPFDLSRGPLLRTLLVREAEAEHVLLLNMHHIVSDGWSFEVLVRELAAFYAAFRESRPARLPALPVRYVDYAAWQRDWLNGGERESQLAYWRQRLAGAPQSLELPTDRPRPAVRTHRGAHASRWIPGDVVDLLLDLGRRESSSLFMVLLAAFKVQLHRLAGEDDILVGSPIAGRGRRELEGLVGIFLNSLVLRTSLAGDPTVRELLGRVRDTALDAYAHQDVPFEMLLDDLKPVRDLSRTPLFQVFFNMLNLPAGEIQVPELTFGSVPVPDLPSKFDLTLYVQPLTDGLRFELAFNSDLFDRQRIEIVLEQLAGILSHFGDDPGARIGSFSLLTPGTRAVLPDPRENLSDEWWGAVHEKLTFHARRDPGRLAVRDGGDGWTYGELEARSNRLAHQLVAAGLRPEEPVAIYAQRCASLVWAVLGTLKAGGAFILLDPAYPPARLIEILKLASPRAWLRLAEAGRPPAELEDFVASLPGCIRLDLEPASAAERRVSGEACEPPDVTVGPDHLAVIAFTSGSTGSPKGILGRHGPLSHFLPWQVERFGLHADDRFSLLSGLSHDPLQRDIFTPLWLGAALCVPDRRELGTPGRMAEWMRRERVSVAHLTPAMAQILAERPVGGTDGELPALRLVLLVGDVLTRRDVLRLRQLAPNVTVVNLYGSTETQRAVGYHVVPEEAVGAAPAREILPLGKGMRDVQLLVLSSSGGLAGIGEVGEICVRSPHLARGYLGDEALTRERFQFNPFSRRDGDRLYRTGDLGRYLLDGSVAFVARADQQVKIRGFRIEPGEIEATLARHPAVREAVVLARPDPAGEKRLVAYVVPQSEESTPLPALSELQDYLRQRLPEYMVPPVWVKLAKLPLTPNGKLDRRALPEPEAVRPDLADSYVAPRTEVEQAIAEIWQEVLQIEKVGVHDKFFNLGGHSLLLVRAHARLRERFGDELSVMDLFRYPDIGSLAQHLTRSLPAPSARSLERVRVTEEVEARRRIAIIGMAGRFPGADSVEELWRNLLGGVESIVRLTDGELAAAGIPREILADPRYVRAGAVLADVDLLDAEFFGLTPREAEVMDPQHRLFLECAWQALEAAGYDPETCGRSVGVYAGAGLGTYALLNLWSNGGRLASLGGLAGAASDHLPTLVSWKLNLGGPSLAVQTACSTSLVAVHLAAQALLHGECDMALAGGASVQYPQRSGYLWMEGGILSPDGRCRAFDAEAGGTIFGNGVGVVVLKRLEDALADGDTIHAVIQGSAVNNDGGGRVGYTAPNLEGQERVIRAALRAAAVEPETIGYVEAHGTGTSLGDPIEVAALTEAFRAGTDRTGFCALGSVKTNLGHLNAAAGVTGLIKAVLSLEHRKIPPTLHFQRPNPRIDFASSPFFVNPEPLPWESGEGPRRAAVNSFGMGGTNAHVILEEAPKPEPTTPSRSLQMLTLSARSAAALEAATDRLVAHLELHPEDALADVSHTLHVGRRGFGHRRMVLARSREEAARALAERDPRRVLTAQAGDRERPIYFLFPGQGSQYVDMARGLYGAEPVFREEMDRSADRLRPQLGFDLREVLFPDPERAAATVERLGRTAVTQPALFVVEHALAKVWIEWGLQPQGMIGHSVGEYVAACLAGVFSFEDALALVALRGRLIEELPGGAMLAVPLPEERIEPLLGDRLSLAAVNGPAMCVVSGSREDIERLQGDVQSLLPAGLECRPLHTSHAFHSAAMDPILAAFTDSVRRVGPKAPSLPFISNVTGRWITAAEAADPAYWARHLRQTVRFAEGLRTLAAASPEGVLLEVGPGRTLTTLARQHPAMAGRPALCSLRHPQDAESDQELLLRTLGQLWLAGVPVDWRAFYARERRRRVPLPTYPFERRRYWIEPRLEAHSAVPVSAPEWVPAPLSAPAAGRARWLVLAEGGGMGADLARRLEAQGHKAVTVDRAGDFGALLREVGLGADLRIVQLWNLNENGPVTKRLAAQARAIESLLALSEALGELDGEGPVLVTLVAEGVQAVTGRERILPENAPLLAACEALPQENPRLALSLVDLEVGASRNGAADLLLTELLAGQTGARIAYREGRRWLRTAPKEAERKEVFQPAEAYHPRPSIGTAYLPPATDAEQEIAAVWRDLFGIAEIGVHDDFFDLGGDSLLIARMASRVREALGVELPLRIFFEQRSVAGLAAAVERERASGQTAGAPPLVRVPRSGDLLLSFSQQRLWLLDQLAPDNPFYNLSGALRLTGALDGGALASAVREVVRRHETLRTGFASVEGQPVQRIAPELAFELPIIDLSDRPASEREAEARRLATEQAGRPFALDRPPLLRVSLLRLEEREHVLLYAMHHIVSDGWSMGALIGEVVRLYDALIQGKPSPLSDLPVQYADFAAWQRVWLQGEILESQLAYWQERMAGAPIVELPADRPRPPVQSFRGATWRTSLSAELSASLAALARERGASPFMVLLAGFDALISRYTGLEDIVVGTPIAGRTRAELEGLIGFFVNTLVLRTDLGGDPSATEVLERVRATAVGAYAHQDLPFEYLVERVQPQRDLSRNPLFQLMFNLLSAPGERMDAGDLAVSRLELAGSTALFDLQVYLAETERGIATSWEYATDLFDAATVARLSRHFAILLERMVANPSARLSELPLLSGSEREQLLVEWNATGRELKRGCVHEWIAAQAALTPDALAVVFGAESLSYRELDRRTNGLARRLRSLGVGPEVRVGVALERSLEMVVGLLAVLKAGGAYVPLDPSFPAERLAFMFEDSGMAALLAQRSLRPGLPEFGGEWVLLSPGVLKEGKLARQQRSGVGPDNAAYVIYTSGSTGRPKGVQISHQALGNFLVSMAERPGFGAQDALLAVTSLSFDIAALEIYLPLTVGGRIVLASREEVADGWRLQELIASSRATVLQATPATWRLLLETGWQGGEGLKALCGGEALPPSLATNLVERVGSLWNVYGPTETTVWSALEEIRNHEGISVGRPIANTKAYLLDGRGSLVPVGAAGELHLGGGGLARGYLGRPELTAERFVPNPFGSPGSRLYRTGDLARYRADGRLECLGRIDHQVKVRGFRIELGEIEAALGRHPQVAAAVVVAREQEGDRRLVAYIVSRQPGADLSSELRAWVRRSLPEHMVPSAWVQLESLPLTPNGKVDRRALPAPAAVEPKTFTAPSTPVEELLAGIWERVLGVERVGAEDGFFDLGGHSLLATQVVSRVREAFGVDLPLRRIFDRPTLAGLAGEIAAALRGDRGAEAPPLRPVPRDGDLPPSFAQERLWFLDRLQPGSAAYNMPAAVRLRGNLDVLALRRTLREIVRRHEALRSRFAVRDGRPLQGIVDELRLDLPVVDLRALPTERQQALIPALSTEEAWHPFELAAGPLLRVTLLRSMTKTAEDEFVVLLTMHHIVSDAWSMQILIRELAILYRAFAAGQGSPLAELPIQYADFAHWQRSWLTGAVLDRQIDYWRRHLQGAPPLLELPTDRPRPAVQRVRGRQHRWRLPVDFGDGLHALCRGEQATLFMGLLASFQGLLQRYSGCEDVIVGTPVAGRNLLETEALIGPFLNNLVLRVDLSGNPDFRQRLARTREVTLGAYAHQDLPFEKLVEELAPERNLSHSPLFQVMLIMQNVPGAAVEMPGLTLTPVEPAEASTAKFDLTLTLGETPGGLAGTLAYDSNLFEAATTSRMLDHLQVLLGGIVEDPERPLLELPLLTAAEEQQLRDWNATGVFYPTAACLHELIEEQAERTPERMAVVFEERSLTYRELNTAANRLAHYLLELGIGAEDRVGICVERSAEMVLAVLGVLKAGGAYVPLDPGHPRERLAYVLRDAGARVLLTQESVAGRLAALLDGVERVVRLDGDWEAISRRAGENPPSLPLPTERLAYVIYTSGSTGQPKGVQIPQRALVNFLESMRERPGLAADDAILAVTTLSFDIAGLELLLPLLVGGRVVIAPQETVGDGAALSRLLADSGATVMQATPATWRLLLESGWPSGVGLRAFSGGEALPRDLAEHLLAKVASLWNLYGPTETTIWSAAGAVLPGEGAVSLGTPIGNTQLHLLDGGGQPVPAGVAGDLFIGGDGVARGYLGRPDLTAERFVPDPFAAGPGARMYSTGDLARRRSDGGLEFLGRADFQVKIRGFRIELGEIEAALASHAGVAQAVVVAGRDGGGGQRLVAYVALSGETAPPARQLRGHLEGLLPGYMVPSAFVVLPALPLTPNGKVDRKALPSPEGAAAERSGDFVAPRTLTEELLASLWAGLLSLPRVGAADDFFQLGGHSLLGTQLVSRVRETFGVELALRRIFERPTLAGLAAEIEAALRGGRGAEAPPLRPVPRDGDLPLSFAQERLWFLDRLQPGSAAYNMPAAVRLRGALDVDAFRRALGEIVRRHESLRTRILVRDGRPIQVIEDRCLEVLSVDLRALSTERRAAVMRLLAAEEAWRPFDLAAGPLLRATLLWARTESGGDEFLVLLTMHHIIADAWSISILIREMATLYGAFAAGQASSLPELPIQYADFAHWQRRWLAGETLERQIDYWRRHLSGAPALLELPLDRPRPALQRVRGRLHRWRLPAGLGEALQALCRGEGATLFMGLLAAFQGLLQRYSGSDDVIVGTPVAGRNLLETEELIGLFLNNLVLRVDLSGNPDFRQRLARTREVTLGAYAHQDLPFEKLVEELSPERNLSHSPLFQVMLILQNAPGAALEMPGLSAVPVEADEGSTAKFDLTLSLGETPDGLAGSLAYDNNLFEAATISRLLGHFEVLLGGLLQNPQRPSLELPLLTPAEAAQLLAWNDTADSYPGERCLQEWIEAQAKRTPERIAACFEAQSLSYRALNAAANRLAHHLLKLGISPEDRVGICLERSLEMIIAVLGVLKAGGAYVPLDPSHPRERLADVLRDAGARVLLTQSRVAERLQDLVAAVERVILLDRDGKEIGRRPGKNPSTSPLPAGHLAYVIYTSGSTGKPKGVQIPHRALVNFLNSMKRRPGLTSDDAMLALTTLSFDIAGLELLLPLVTGARVIVAPALAVADGAALVRLLADSGATVMQATPAGWRLLLDSGWRGDPGLRAFCGGEALPRDLAERLLDKVAGLWNLYGPTETTIWSTADPVHRGEGGVPIGSPIANTQIHLLDRGGQPVALGVPGELFIGGDGVARGYLDRPDLTAERFVPDPFAAGPGSRMYRTGDLVRRRPAGALEFMGRTDFQVKIRGFRIEPGEIEAQLARLAGVREAIVLARGEGPGDQRLVAYVTLDPAAGEAPSVAQMRKFLRERLPAYMVPAGFVVLEHLPFTPNGKVDRQALLRIDDRQRETNVDFRMPQSEAELAIASILQEVLKIDQVGVDHNFFDLGGNSLLLAQVHSRLQERFGREILLVDIFNHSTARALATYLEGDPASAPAAAPSGDRAKQLRQGRDRLRRRFQQQKG